MEKDGRQRGFSGISGLVSDLSSLEDSPQNKQPEIESKDDNGRIEPKLGKAHPSDPTANERNRDNSVSSHRVNKSETTSESSQKKSPSTHRVDRSKSKSKNTYTPGDENKSGNGGKWFFAIIGVVFLIWLVNQADGPSNTTRSSSSPSYSPPISKPSLNQSTAQTTKPGINYQIPLVGRNNVLSITEIRWCSKESIRIEAMQNVNTTQKGINRFNRIVSDYNSRCGEYRYRQGNLSRAQRDVEPYRSQIVAEAIREAKGYDTTYSPTYSSKPSTPKKISSSKKPSVKFTREAQQLLTNLGYKPGPIDGLYGHKTSEAVKSFQRTTGIKVDGWVDEDIITELRKAKTLKERSQVKTKPRISYDKEITPRFQVETNRVSTSDQVKIEAYCARVYSTPGDENKCIQRELAKVKQTGGRPSLSGVTQTERQTIEAYCARVYSTPGDEYKCIQRELAKVKQTGGRPSLSGVTQVERQTIEAYCARVYSTPGDEYKCLLREKNKLR